MSNFKIVVPVLSVTENLLVNPSFEITTTGTWTVGTVSRVVSDQWVGAYALQADASAQDCSQTVTVTATAYSIQAMVKRPGGGVPTLTQVRFITEGFYSNPTSIEHIQDNWYLCKCEDYTPSAGSSAWGVNLRESGLLIDALQLENTSYCTTYFDGDSIGYRDIAVVSDTYGYQWTGDAHESTSQRHGQERSGGRVYDLEDDLGVTKVNAFNGGGTPQYDHKLISYALLPGAQYQGTKIQPRIFDLGLTFSGGANLYTLHDNRYLLQDAVKINKVKPKQPLKFRYTTNDKYLEIDCFYAGGLEFTNPNKTVEKTATRFVAPDPYWKRLKQEVTVLTVNSATTVSNGGGERAFPVIRIEGTGSVDSLTNAANGDVITFDGLFVFSGESIVIDLRLGYKTLTSSVRGSLLGAVTTGSSLSNWALEVGDNDVTLAASGQGNLVDHSDNQLVDHNGNSLVIGASLSLSKSQVEFYETYETVDGINQ